MTNIDLGKWSLRATIILNFIYYTALTFFIGGQFLGSKYPMLFLWRPLDIVAWIALSAPIVIFLLFITLLVIVLIKFISTKTVSSQIWLSIGINFLALVAYFFLAGYFHWGAKIYTRDARRIADVKQVLLALELYQKEKGGYPIVTSACNDLSILNKFLVPNFISYLPRESLEAQEYTSYKYAVSSDGLQFVVGVTFEKYNSALQQDLEGIVLGCNCDDPNYCMGNIN